MPVYDYRCRECEHIWKFEHSVKVDNAVEELGLKCENCDSVDIHKYLGNYKSMTVRFVGHGFAINDTALDRIGYPKSFREKGHPAYERTKDKLGRD